MTVMQEIETFVTEPRRGYSDTPEWQYRMLVLKALWEILGYIKRSER